MTVTEAGLIKITPSAPKGSHAPLGVVNRRRNWLHRQRCRLQSHLITRQFTK